MTVETATYISQLDPTKPGINDPKSEGDDHLRLTKSVLQNQFPSLGAAAVTVTAADLNSVPGKAAKAGDTYSGTHDMTGATVRVATQAATDASTKAASTAMVQNAILASSGITATLPGQGGNAGKVLKTNGVSPAWGFSGASLTAGRASNVQLTAADGMTFIDITGGTFTQTFDACASLGAGWWCYLRNSSSGDITLDPNGSETIDGLTSFVMYHGEVRLVMCDGSALKSVVLASFYKAFTASGTFTTPPGYSQFAGLLWGGGSSGVKAGGATNGYGGGGGACVPFTLPASAFGSSKVVTIAAEAIGPSTGGNGTQGNNSSIGSLLTAYGGGVAGYDSGSSTNYSGSGGGVFSAGSSTPSGSGGGAPAVASGGNPGFGGANGVGSGTAGLDSVYGGASGSGGDGAGVNRPGGKSVYGGGGGGAAGTVSAPTGSSPGGISVFGGAGGAGGNYGSGSSGGIDGIAPGGGGGGSPSNGAKAGNGARGELRIWGVI